VRDHAERDLAVHLESALRGVIIGDRWPKSGVDVVITVLEGEEDVQKSLDGGGQSNSTGPWGLMTVLSACITVASAAIADAGIDCVDIVSGGVAAIVRDADGSEGSGEAVVILDPAPQEHSEVVAACVVGYLPTRDEITNIWIRGDMTEDVTAGALSSYETLSENAVQAAKGAHRVLSAALRESLSLKLNS
jgi:exosome complex component MTR3